MQLLMNWPVRIGCKLCNKTNYYRRNIIRNLSSRPQSLPPWKVMFYGTDDFSLESLKVIHHNWLYGNPRLIELFEVVTVAQKIPPLAVRKYSKENDLLLHDWPYCPKDNEFDVGVVVSFGYLVSNEIIQSFPLGLLNVHASLLPRWRGAAPIYHTILNGDTETGVTIMQIEPHQFDTGKILSQKKYLVPERITALQLRKDLARMGGKLLIEGFDNLNELMLNSELQDRALATKAPKIKPEMAVIKWQEHSCQYIDRLCRALFDTLSLQTNWHGHVVRLSDMVAPSEITQTLVNKLEEAIKSTGEILRPGKVVFHKKRKVLLVKCKDGWVGFRCVTHKGKRVMSAAEFYNGYISKVAPQQSYFE